MYAYFRERCVCICVYVLYYEGGWEGGILVMIHILFLKGAGVFFPAAKS